MTSEPTPVSERWNFWVPPFLCLAGVVTFFFTLHRGIAPLPYLASGVLAGALALIGSLLGERFRLRWLSSIGTASVFLVHIFAEDLDPAGKTLHLTQWICVTAVTFFGVGMLSTPRSNRDDVTA
jgi:hypothetical protein